MNYSEAKECRCDVDLRPDQLEELHEKFGVCKSCRQSISLGEPHHVGIGHVGEFMRAGTGRVAICHCPVCEPLHYAAAVMTIKRRIAQIVKVEYGTETIQKGETK